MWEVGRKISVPFLAVLCLACPLAFLSKFTGVTLPIVLTLMVVARVGIARDWVVWKWTAKSWKERFVAGFVVVFTMALVSYVAIWACYRFRYAPSPGAR